MLIGTSNPPHQHQLFDHGCWHRTAVVGTVCAAAEASHHTSVTTAADGKRIMQSLPECGIADGQTRPPPMISQATGSGRRFIPPATTIESDAIVGLSTMSPDQGAGSLCSSTPAGWGWDSVGSAISGFPAHGTQRERASSAGTFFSSATFIASRTMPLKSST